ncbi:MAG: vanadium-dependent haloperoxidase [Candidatus Kapabacteria bacterium]|nr:vanadium-dependent haloperoxidase [Candidatus Kapabacteria bacterium]
MKRAFVFVVVLLFSIHISSFSENTKSVAVKSISKVTGKDASKYSSKHLQDWLDLSIYLAQRNRGFTPVVAARAYGYLSLTAYEAMVSGSTKYCSMQNQISEYKNFDFADENKEYHWSAVSNAALRKVLNYLFINDYSSFPQLSVKSMDSLETFHNDRFKKEASDEIIKRSIEYGQKVADQIIAYSKTDNQEFCWKDEKNFPVDYKVPTGRDKWVPKKGTIPDALHPEWGKVRTYSQKNSRIFDINPPHPYSEDTTSLFFKEALETFTLSQRCFNVKDPKDKHLNVISQYWNDEPYRSATPAGHSLSIARHIITKENMPLDKASELIAKVGMSLHDAFVFCWNVKYNYNTIRPITYIRKMDYFKKPNCNMPIACPPFPEYIAGHATESGAAMEALTSMMGDNYKFTDSTHFVIRFDLPEDIVVPRTFNSFYECAEEIAISRVYGGIHFRKAGVEGTRVGKLVAKNVLAFKFKKD